MKFPVSTARVSLSIVSAIAGFVVMALFGGCSASQERAEEPVRENIRATSFLDHYVCSEGLELTVGYIRLDDGRSFATFDYAGTLHVMHAAVAASGVLYVDFDSDSALEWHTKGDGGTLLRRARESEGRDTLLATDCVAQ